MTLLLLMGHARPSPGITHPLEAFQQLGLLYAKPRGSDDFAGSNYVLVTSVYDDSIWVLRRKYIRNLDTLNDEIAKAVWPYTYGLFPGRPSEQSIRETIIYARIANNWDSLQPSPDWVLQFLFYSPRSI